MDFSRHSGPGWGLGSDPGWWSGFGEERRCREGRIGRGGKALSGKGKRGGDKRRERLKQSGGEVGKWFYKGLTRGDYIIIFLLHD